MALTTLIQRLPSYSQGIQQMLLAVFEQDSLPLSKPQLYGISLSVGYLLKHEKLLNAIRAEAKIYLEELDATACKTAAIGMSINNTYYNFSKNGHNSELSRQPSGVSMQSLASSLGIEITPEFEMYCLACSILNGCHFCINLHIDRLLARGVSIDSIAAIGKVVSLLKGVRDLLEIERLRSYDFNVRDAAM